MNKPLQLATWTLAMALAACASPTVPDNIPPQPHARKTAPHSAADEGFSDDGFGGETPTLDATDTPDDQPEPDPEPVNPD